MAWVFEYNMLTTSNPSVALQEGTFIVNENPNILVEINYIKENLQNTKIIDSRETSEYFGITKSPNNKVYGHIPYAKSSYYKDKFLEDLSIKSDDVLEKIFVLGLGLNKDDEVIIYGNTIFSASMNWYILYKKLGFKNAKIYEASFVQWSNSEETTTTQYKWE
jgi:thiosulfate/3-mercaptopyruvate sulfurtransferase